MKRIKKYILGLLLIILPVLFAYYIKSSIFPFVTVKYINNEREFNNYSVPMVIPDKINKYFIKKYLFIKTEKNIYKKAYYLATAVRKKLYHAPGIIDDLNKVFSGNKEYPAICSGYSKLLAALAQSLEYKSRVIWLSGHTVSEVYFDNYGWVLIDANLNTIYKNKYNKFVSLIEVIENFDNLQSVPLTDYKTDNDPEYNSEILKKVMRNNPLIFIISGKDLFNFEKKMHSIKYIIKYICGQNIVNGAQYIKNRNRLGNKRKDLIIFSIIYLLIFGMFIKNILAKNKKN